jgi:hypothetical protein
MSPLIAVAVEAHFQGDFDCGRSVVRVEHLAQPFRRARQQAFGQFDCRRMTETCQQNVFELPSLLRDCFSNFRMCVAKQIGPPRTDCIEVALAVVVFQPDTFAAPDRYQRQ